MDITWLNRTLITGPHLALCLCEEEFIAAQTLIDLPESEHSHWVGDCAVGAMHSFTSPVHGFVAIICIDVPPEYDGIDIAGVLVHECVHVWQAWCKHLGERKPSKEFEAYSIENFSKTFMAEFRARSGIDWSGV